jgi:23S rRNA pseudouridine1911/1915/1917 synthase
MVMARTEPARQSLIEQIKDREVSRRYLAVVNGLPVSGETIDQPIGRHQHDRLRMAVTERGKPAVTHIRIKQKFRSHSLVEAILETGRTHQIRVHLAWRGFPLVGDPLYGGRVKLPPSAEERVINCLQGFNRQALHAYRLSLVHPASQQNLTWQQEMPEDMDNLLRILNSDQALKSGNQ